jgi:hypothetical protein
MTVPESASVRRRIVPVLLGAVGILLVGAAVLMWAHYGSVVFLEMIRAGIAACFG